MTVTANDRPRSGEDFRSDDPEALLLSVRFSLPALPDLGCSRCWTGHVGCFDKWRHRIGKMSHGREAKL